MSNNLSVMSLRTASGLTTKRVNLYHSVWVLNQLIETLGAIYLERSILIKKGLRFKLTGPTQGELSITILTQVNSLICVGFQFAFFGNVNLNVGATTLHFYRVR